MTDRNMTDRNMTDRKGDWIQTYRGKQFWPLDPRASEIDPVDVAHSLGMQARYSGHCMFFYSVAEHCVHLAKQATTENRLPGLLHDAGEAFFSDIPRPIKADLSQVKGIERALDLAVCERFKLTCDPWPAEIKDLDTRITLNERDAFMRKPPADWKIPGEPLPGVKIQGWSPHRAKMNYLDMLEDLNALDSWVGLNARFMALHDALKRPWGRQE